MMALLPDIDKAASRANARRQLKQYRTLARMAHVKLDDLKSPTIDDMPKAPSTRNRAEDSVIDRISDTEEAWRELKRIDAALNYLPMRSHCLLVISYCRAEEPSLDEVAEMMGISDGKTASYLRDIALLEFAEAYSDKLLVFK